MRWTLLHILQFVWILFLLAFAVALLVACTSNEELILSPADGPSADSAPQNSFAEKNASDTIYVHDTVVVYKDTVDKEVEIKSSYTSFIYRDSANHLDTVLRESARLTCDMEEESFTCKYAMQPLINPVPEYKKVEFHLDSAPVVVLMDTIYKDTLFRNTFTKKYDTTFINYGDNRLTDYIPPEYVYDLGEHPFDSTAMRDFFDTLDVRDPQLGRNNRFVVNSKLSFTGFPAVVMRVENAYEFADLVDIDRTWPAKRRVIAREYVFENFNMKSDSTVTWTLGFMHYENGVGEKDSIQVTTFFKVK